MIRAAILAPMLMAIVLVVKPITSKAWSWYKPWTWPVYETVKYTVSDWIWTPTEGCPMDDELMARVKVDGEDGAKDFYSQTPIAWNYAVARALEGKRVHVKLEADWNARTEDMRSQYPSPVEGGHGSDRKWLILHKYDMGADMEEKDIPYLNSSSDKEVDCFQDGAIFVPENCDITIDLNGQMISRKAYDQFIADGEIFYVSDGATLTIVDSNPNYKHPSGSSNIYGGVIKEGSSSNGAGAIQIKDGAKVYIEGGNFLWNSSSNDGGAIKIDGSRAELHVSETTFRENRAATGTIERNYGGAIAGYDATMELRNLHFLENKADNRGGALFNKSGMLSLIDCRFDKNEVSNDYGGAAYLSSSKDDPTMLLEQNEFNKNSAGKHGGAIYFDTAGNVDAYGTKVKANSAGINGGGIYVNGKGVCLCDAEVKDNYSFDNGAGIYVDSIEDLNVMGKVVVTDNTEYTRGTTWHYVDNVCLQNGNASVAYLNNGGLSVGSKIGVNSTDRANDDGIMVVKNISEFAAKKYFFADIPGEKIKFEGDHNETASFTASMIGGNAGVLIVLGSVAVLMFAFAVVLFIRKRKGAVDETEK